MKTSTLRFSISRIMRVLAVAVVFAVATPQGWSTASEDRPGANQQNRTGQNNHSTRGGDRGHSSQSARPTQGGGTQGQRPKATATPQHNQQRPSVVQSPSSQQAPVQVRPSQSQARPSSLTKPSQSQTQPQGPVPGQRPGANIGGSNNSSSSSSNSAGQRPGNVNPGNNKPANQPGHNGGNGGNSAPGNNWGNNNGHKPGQGAPGHNGTPGHNPGGPGHNPGGPGQGPGHNPGHGGPGHNWGPGPGGPQMGIPPRPHMPAPHPFAVPPRPHSWRPVGPMPTFTTILGMTLDMTLDATLNYLYTGGYNILGYNNSMVYLSNVMMLNMAWPDATLYYTPSGLLQASEFVYSTIYPDYSRYNLAYNSLTRSYGAPVSMTNSNGGMTATWFGNGNRFVTLSYMPQYSAGGVLQYYTTLSFGI